MKHTKLFSFGQVTKQKGQPAFPIYLIVAKEEADQSNILKELLQVWQQSPTGNGVVTLSGESLTEEEFKKEVNTSSLFDHRRIYLILQAEKLKKEVAQLLQKVLENPPPLFTFVVGATMMRADNSLYQIAEKKGVVLDLGGEKPWEKNDRYLKWIGEIFAHAQKKVTPQLCQTILRQTGADANALKNEVEKLIVFVGARPEIQMDDLLQLCVPSAPDSQWQWGHLILQGDHKGAYLLGKSLLSQGMTLQGLLAQLRSQFQTTFRVQAIVQGGGGSKEIQTEFPYMKGKMVDQAIDLSRQCSTVRLRRGLLLINEIDLLSRGTLSDSDLLLELLIAKLANEEAEG